MNAVDIAFRAGSHLPQREAVIARVDHGQGGREIMDAAFRGDVAEVERLAASDPSLLRASDGTTDLISAAVVRGDLSMTERLLALGAPPDGPGGERALFLALRADSPALAEALLRGGADPNGAPEKARPLDAAIYLGSAGAVRLLLDRGADPNQADAAGATALFTACATGQAELALLLLDRGADPWALGVNGDTAPDYLRTAPAGPDASARARLVEQLRARGAWPPVAPADARRLALQGRWPEGAGGRGPPPPGALLAAMRARWGSR